ncbi:MAG: hypothetical protein OXC03_08265 [Flavobacteriaceae bacterium]|nr:hypothetical protein [Flavobacteriaceae bacterium]
MESTLGIAFRINIEALQGSNFENFIDQMFQLKYGADDYVPTRRARDKGNDGTVLSEKKYWLVMLQNNTIKLLLNLRF